MPRNYLAKYLSEDDLNKIAGVISDIEKHTSGEIRICIKVRRGVLEGKFTPRELALDEFLKAGMHNTKDKTGVLIYILFDERKFEIIADEGINAKISESHWDEIKNEISCEFKNENYLDGLTKAINDIGNVLKNEFPPSGDNTDELSNEVIVK